MTSQQFEIVEADWPDPRSQSAQAIRDFLASGLGTAEIKGNKTFLVSVRRASKSNKEFLGKVQLKMVDGRMFIRRTEASNNGA